VTPFNSPAESGIPFLDPEDSVLAESAVKFGAMAVVISPKGVILHLRDDKSWIPHPGCWSLFGGAVEPDETPYDAIVRELEEELGLRENAYRPRWQIIDHGGDGRLLTIFEVRTTYGPDQMTLTEGQGLQAFQLEEALAQRLAPFCRRVLSQYTQSEIE